MAEPTPRDRMLTALRRQPPLSGPVPHFELVFFLTMEAFGRVHFSQRHFGQWAQMTERERELHRDDQARLYIDIAERFGHGGICLQPNPGTTDELLRLAERIRTLAGDRYALFANDDPTFSMPNGHDMVDFSVRMAEETDAMKDEAERRLDGALARAERLRAAGLFDAFTMCADYAMNIAPFFSPDQFGELIAPYLKRFVAGLREMGFLSIKHTDGCLWPILDQIVDAAPDALHSIDPQGGMDLARVKREYGDRLCLIGNVSCAALDTGTDEDVVENVRATLRAGMPGGGYVFSTSNCIYTGMRLARYELMLDVFRREGVYA